MPIRGLRSESYRDNKAVYHNDFMHSDGVAFMPRGHMAFKNAMFAPLVLEEKAVGIIGLANKPSDFNDNDAEMATGFGKLAAIGHQKSKYLLESKMLSGLLPMCMHCKNIRDDKGYWNRSEIIFRGTLTSRSAMVYAKSVFGNTTLSWGFMMSDMYQGYDTMSPSF